LSWKVGGARGGDCRQRGRQACPHQPRLVRVAVVWCCVDCELWRGGWLFAAALSAWRWGACGARLDKSVLIQRWRVVCAVHSTSSYGTTPVSATRRAPRV
jgi:hypothetical protein